MILGKSNFVKNCNNMKVDCSHPQHQIKNGDIMLTYIGKEGYLANLELREGKQHCQKGTPEFLDETIGICR